MIREHSLYDIYCFKMCLMAKNMEYLVTVLPCTFEKNVLYTVGGMVYKCHLSPFGSWCCSVVLCLMTSCLLFYQLLSENGRSLQRNLWISLFFFTLNFCFPGAHKVILVLSLGIHKFGIIMFSC